MTNQDLRQKAKELFQLAEAVAYKGQKEFTFPEGYRYEGRLDGVRYKIETDYLDSSYARVSTEDWVITFKRDENGECKAYNGIGKIPENLYNILEGLKEVPNEWRGDSYQQSLDDLIRASEELKQTCRLLKSRPRIKNIFGMDIF
ncbi:hypothetical protein J4221_05685 [Candidatus Pacearchaeota archaeon]|nr:hypothetical protein [Candidatus Pacearchaeota archaeon]